MMEKIINIFIIFAAVVTLATITIWLLINIAIKFGDKGKFIAGVLAVIIFFNVAFFAFYR